MQKPSRILVLGNRSALLSFTALRIVLGVIMAAHGLQKIADPSKFAHHLDQMGFPLPTVMAYLAMAGELLGGLGLILGLFTPVAAFGVAVTMLVAVLAVHLENGLFAANGGFEFPLILMMGALWFMTAGAGPYSLDAILRAARESRSTGATPYARPVANGAASDAPTDVVTEAGHESFPASDPPAHSSSRTHH